MDVYSGVADFLSSGDYTEDDIREATLQVCSEIDKPDPPGPAARKAFYRQLVGLDDDRRQRFKRRLLELDRESVERVSARYLNRIKGASATAVISAREMLENANQELGVQPLDLYPV